jgi:hypothetical protein
VGEEQSHFARAPHVFIAVRVTETEVGTQPAPEVVTVNGEGGDVAVSQLGGQSDRCCRLTRA